MNETQILDIARDSVWVMIVIAAPVLLVGLAVGLLVSLFQALTSLQEATLVFVPKMLIVFGAIIFLLPFMLRHITQFTQQIMDLIISLP
ncbi:flagellar biosynthesis protein FliQ [Haematospirillum jordaniae]|uniref:Flagellar biosynthetic protein FliQ n=1 Tax=Haematospirillum jordaniae TaxID=1549855 RepID=A0A143DC06_9PROT|nr:MULTISPECIES: flagellar biosynthesis protein FliQ [Haematospirillum]AMW33823.1 flagellar biosynthetic protein FliQ [Haematospirillum jordaniae]NKD44542.1 flagellar biosynthesis protein FliQ [Haematospirillum jordaniae]NKD57562.1 flagellar biosynthesis protein FliQ [Haematospirillum jordaniae]NKD59460.1 flagellar biosynthesis protein FliQ [Haematospirillum jordaniae]NKD67455.1 flagellar biosynthesis protein FliQ [Haematospirillum jordaniae]